MNRQEILSKYWGISAAIDETEHDLAVDGDHHIGPEEYLSEYLWGQIEERDGLAQQLFDDALRRLPRVAAAYKSLQESEQRWLKLCDEPDSAFARGSREALIEALAEIRGALIDELFEIKD